MYSWSRSSVLNDNGTLWAGTVQADVPAADRL